MSDAETYKNQILGIFLGSKFLLIPEILTKKKHF